MKKLICLSAAVLMAGGVGTAFADTGAQVEVVGRVMATTCAISATTGSQLHLPEVLPGEFKKAGDISSNAKGQIAINLTGCTKQDGTVAHYEGISLDGAANSAQPTMFSNIATAPLAVQVTNATPGAADAGTTGWKKVGDVVSKKDTALVQKIASGTDIPDAIALFDVAMASTVATVQAGEKLDATLYFDYDYQ